MTARPTIPDGAVDTPATLARRLAEELFSATGPTSVLDPSCGNGELLLGALAAAKGDPGFAARSLFGIELRPERAAEARARILSDLAPKTTDAERIHVAAALADHIVCGDALDPAQAWPSGTHILANPPWMSLSGRHTAELPADRLDLYRQHWRVLSTAWPSIHGAFLERIAAHLNTGDPSNSGRRKARILIPTAVCELERYGPTRALIEQSAHLDAAPLDLGEEVFADITQPTTLLSLAGGTAPRPNSSSLWQTASDSAEPATARERNLLRGLADFPRLPEKTFTDPGVHTGNSAKELILKNEAEARASEFHYAPVHVGRDLAPYALGPASQWLRTDLQHTQAQRFRIPALEQMCAFPILVRQTASHPIAALHTDPTYFRNSLLACRPVPGLDPAFLVAVLNSPLIATWHRHAHRDARQRNFPQVKVAHLAGLPFPIRSRAESPVLHDEIAARVRQLDSASATFTEEVELIEALVENAFGLARDDSPARPK